MFSFGVLGCVLDWARWRRFTAALVGLIISITCSAASEAASPIVRVEEDWELQLLVPDPSSAGPQITCVISPVSGTGGVHAVFEVNHRTQPDYAAGGMQPQIWDGPRLLSVKSLPKTDVLSQEGETIRWTQRMHLFEHHLVFDVVGGTSSTWGAFGGEGTLMGHTTTSLTSLEGYHPGFSADNSGIGFASNQVAKLVLKEVRCYTSDGLVYQSTNSHVVYQK
jgi:hypothetical protein